MASGNDITITQNLLTDAVSTGGGLTKDGVGSLTLTGINTYTGDTTVNEGTLSLGDGTSNTSLADTAKVFIAAGATLNLNYSGTDTVKELWVNGVQKAPGVYEAVGNPGSGTEIPEITGSGTLTVRRRLEPLRHLGHQPALQSFRPQRRLRFRLRQRWSR